MTPSLLRMIRIINVKTKSSPAANMGLLTTPAAGATQGLTASPIRQTV